MPTSTATPKAPAITPETVDIAGTVPLRSAEWNLATFASITAAQEMLDHLEAQGIVEREFVLLDKSSFGVRWR